jgi:hypothetical protein
MCRCLLHKNARVSAKDPEHSRAKVYPLCFQLLAWRTSPEPEHPDVAIFDNSRRPLAPRLVKALFPQHK